MTFTVIVFRPTVRLTGVAGLFPLTVTVAFGSVVVGVTVKLIMLFATLAV